MTQHPQPRETPARVLKAATAGDARKLAEDLMDVMSALLGIIERETELVRAGKVAAAMALEPNKTDLSRRYVSAVEHLNASRPYLSQTAPELLTTLHRHRDVFPAILHTTLPMLAPPPPAPET